jgi:HK97 family phage portal protein
MRGLRLARRALSFESIFGHDLTRDTAGATNVTTESARRSMAVWACQSLISGDLANLPFQPFVKRGDVREPLVPQPSWVDEPNPLNPNFTDISYRRQVGLSLLQDGNVFVSVFPNVFEPEQLTVLNPSQVNIKDGDGMPVYEVVGLNKQLTLGRLSPLNLVHIPFILPPGHSRGLNPIEAARQGITLDLAAQGQGVKFLDGGGLMTGVIEVPAAAGELKQAFKRRREGPKGYSIGVLQGGATFRQVMMSQQDSQYIETRKFQLEEIARLYLIPPFMVGSQEASGVAYASSVEREQHYIDHCLIHYAGPIEKGHRRLLPGPDTYMKFNFNALLRGNTKERYEAYAVGLEHKFLYQEDVARFEDMDPDRTGTYLETPNNNGPRPTGAAIP